MAQKVLERVLEELKELRPAELREVERTARRLLEPETKAAEREAALLILEQSGMVRNIRRPPMVARPQRKPAQILGKPISQTIIEERR